MQSQKEADCHRRAGRRFQVSLIRDWNQKVLFIGCRRERAIRPGKTTEHVVCELRGAILPDFVARHVEQRDER